MRVGSAGAFLLLLASGCLSASTGDGPRAAPPDPHDLLAWADLGGLVYSADHDHSDRELHVEVARNVTPLNASALSEDGKSLGEYTEADAEHGLVAIAVTTGPGADVRVVLLDEKALPNLTIVGYFDEPRAYGDVKFDNERPIVYVPYPGGLRFVNDPANPLSKKDPAFSIWDVTDPGSPRRLGEAPGTGCHMLHPMRVAGVPYVWCTSAAGALTFRIEALPDGSMRGVPVASAFPQSDPASPLEMQEYYAKLTPYGAILAAGNHDMTAQPDPLTGAPLLVTAHELNGIRVFDVSTPAAPREISHWRGQGMDQPLDRVHTVGLAKVGERRIGFGATETFRGDEPVLYVVDFTDWAAPRFLARWSPPGVPSDEGLTYSLHNFQVVGTRLYVTNFHAGMWVLDVADPAYPVELALRTPVRDTEYPRPEEIVIEGVPMDMNWYWDVIVVRGYALVTDMSSGVEVLHVAGDPAGDDAWRGFT